MGLQGGALLVGGAGDPLDDGAEERLEVLVGRQLAVGRGLGVGAAGLGGGVDDGHVQDGVEVDVGVLVGQVAGQGQQQVGGLGDDLIEPGVGAVHLVDHEDDRQVRGQGLAQHEAGLGQGPLGGVDEEDDAVDHGQPALDLTAEVGVAGGVDDVDDDALGAAGVRGRGARVVDRRVLGEDRDALLALQLAGVHDPLTGGLLGGPGPEGPRLPKHGVDKSGLAVVDVGDNGDVAQILAHAHRGHFFRWEDAAGQAPLRHRPQGTKQRKTRGHRSRPAMAGPTPDMCRPSPRPFRHRRLQPPAELRTTS